MKGRDHSEDLDADGGIIVGWILEKSGSGQGPVVGSCEHDNKLSGYIKGG
jgi:hypothetical protein